MEIKKYFIIFNIASFFGFSAAYTSPLISFSDNANAFFNASQYIQWQSNTLYEENNEQDDLLFIFIPGLEMNLGSETSSFNLNLAVDYAIYRYNDLTDLDREYFNIMATSSYETARWSMNSSASFAEKQSTVGQENAIGSGGDDNDVTDNLILIDDTKANIEVKYEFSQKFSFESGVNYFDRKFTNNDQLADREVFTFPFDMFYKLTPKLDLSSGYQFSHSNIERSIFPTNVGDIVVGDHSMESHFVNIGARGKLLPKLSGFFKVGYRDINPENSTRTYSGTPLIPLPLAPVQRDSQKILGFDADFTYLVTPKLTSHLFLYRGFDVGSEGQTVQNNSANLSADYTISNRYTASSFFRYTLREFADGPSTGDDIIYNIGILFSYVPDKHLRFSMGYTYVENDSERIGQNFVNNIFTLSAAFRY